MFKQLTIGSAILAAAFTLPNTAVNAAGPAASEWSIGPIIRGRNYSVNMPRTMQETRDGPAFDFPYPAAANGHVHYVTVPVRSLEGAKRITLTYRIDAKPGTRFLEQENPAGPATLSLYIQRAGDRWTARTPHHRWYSPAGRDLPLSPGTHTVSISLTEPWIAMMGGDASSLPQAFDAALRETSQIGFTFGGASGRGHGVFATAPARFTVLDYRIE
ncbi:hypothetical protein [Allopontixanthobacter sediminis]|uniref:Uncharacterized protein n=1 Tax=Allopontixanthobacter sediminis TaxID=1689985 RepID=A0A845AZV5_9SPHN|nr:hypothetical protein [Allopontixanthobacter sediminis]MXP43466.1 hypothetical protein [Allopontixanthobacter sediminis]